MSKFTVINAEEKYLSDCSPGDIGLIHKAYWAEDESVEIMHGDGKWYLSTSDLYPASIYRVLAKPYTLEDGMSFIQKNSYQINTQHFSGEFIEYELAVKALQDLAASLGDKS